MARRRGRFLKSKEETIYIIKPAASYSDAELIAEYQGIVNYYTPTSKRDEEQIGQFSLEDRIVVITFNFLLPNTILNSHKVVRDKLLFEDETATNFKDNNKSLRIMTIESSSRKSRLICREN